MNPLKKNTPNGLELKAPSTAVGGSPTIARGLEPHVGNFDNPMETSRKGNGPRPFMGHSGPVAGDSGVDRGQFSSRSLLTSK